MVFEISVTTIVLAIIQLFAGLILSVISVYLGISLIDKLTKNIDEWKEIKKGNVAIGILLASVIISIAIILESSVSSSLVLVSVGLNVSSLLFRLLIIMINMLIGVAAAIFSIYIAFRVIDKLTIDIDELTELKKGNVAVALVVGAIIFAISLMIKTSIAGIIISLNLVGLVN